MNGTKIITFNTWFAVDIDEISDFIGYTGVVQIDMKNGRVFSVHSEKSNDIYNLLLSHRYNNFTSIADLQKSINEIPITKVVTAALTTQ